MARRSRSGSTNRIELVETQALALALKRLQSAPPYDDSRWRRALYHALCMTYAGSVEVRRHIREALGLE